MLSLSYTARKLHLKMTSVASHTGFASLLRPKQSKFWGPPIILLIPFSRLTSVVTASPWRCHGCRSNAVGTHKTPNGCNTGMVMSPWQRREKDRESQIRTPVQCDDERRYERGTSAVTLNRSPSLCVLRLPLGLNGVSMCSHYDMASLPRTLAVREDSLEARIYW